jgi:hypothetical protein
MKRIILMAVSVFLALTLAAPVAFGQVAQRPPASEQTGQLAAAWWTWASSKPIEDNSLIGSYEGGARCDGTPVTPTRGPTRGDTWFLAGSTSSEPVVRTCTNVPADTQIFFPVVNFVWVNTDPGETQKLARQEANEFIDSLLADPDVSIVVTVDGTVVQSDRIVLADSPFFNMPLPENNIFGVEPGNYRAVADGLWVTLPPLSEGEHTIHWEFHDGFSQDITYNLTVG